VHEHDPGIELPADAESSLRVPRVDTRDQAVLGPVGDLERLILVAELDDADHRPEDLLTGDPHLRRHPDEHRGSHEVAPRETWVARQLGTCGDRRPFGDAELDVLLDPILLTTGDER